MNSLPTIPALQERIKTCRACPHLKHEGVGFAMDCARYERVVSVADPKGWTCDIWPTEAPAEYAHRSPPAPTQPAAEEMSETWKREGPKYWKRLHRWAMKIREPIDIPKAVEFLTAFDLSLPCGKCREHFVAIKKKHPPDFTSTATLFKSTWEWHEAVNADLGKLPFPFESALDLYRQPTTDPDSPRR